jgi:short-subunit dehydrogenase
MTQPWAVITGASTGIGYELAKLFAADGYNLVLVARNQARLERVAGELQGRGGIATLVVACDLADAAAAQKIFNACEGKEIAVLVNNAGFGLQEPFAKSKLSGNLEMMHTNMDAVVHLTYLFLQPMLARGAGRILNVASTAAFQPGPFTNVYYATKAFVFSFSVALSEELAGSGVTVTALCPGYTRTEFHDRAHIKRSSYMVRMMSAERVARDGYRGLRRGRTIVIPGLVNKVMSAVSRRLSPRFTARIVRRINGE